MPRYYPIFLDVEGKPCLVVGGGEVAERKVVSLLEHGAKVRVVSPRLVDGLLKLQQSGEVTVESREYRKGDVDGSVLAIAATDDNELNAQVAREAVRANIAVNVVDDPEKSTFIVPSLFKRGDISIAISTGGKSPALAKRIRIALERLLPEELGELADMLSVVRKELKSRGISVDKETWQDALDMDSLLDLLRQGKPGEARERIVRRLEGQRPSTHQKRG